MPSFQLNGSTVTYDDQPAQLTVVDARQLVEHESPDRHTFTVRLADGMLVCVSWDPDQPGDRPQRVWVEASAVASLMMIDRPGAWQRWAAGRESKPDYPSRFVPRAMPADEADAMCADVSAAVRR